MNRNNDYLTFVLGVLLAKEISTSIPARSISLLFLSPGLSRSSAFGSRDRYICVLLERVYRGSSRSLLFSLAPMLRRVQHQHLLAFANLFASCSSIDWFIHSSLFLTRALVKTHMSLNLHVSMTLAKFNFWSGANSLKNSRAYSFRLSITILCLFYKGFLVVLKLGFG